MSVEKEKEKQQLNKSRATNNQDGKGKQIQKIQKADNISNISKRGPDITNH